MLSETTYRANHLNGKEWLKNSFSIWRDLDKNKEERKLKHPAIFNLSLIDKLIKSFVYKQEDSVPVLLDCFAGSGTSLIAGLLNDMDVIGFDISREYRDLFEKRLADYSFSRKRNYYVSDARHLSDTVKCKVDTCITSPPYWNILNNKRTVYSKETVPYTKLNSDLGNIDEYNEFMASLKEVFGEVLTVLKKGGILIVNVMDVRKKGTFYPLHSDIILECRNMGFKLRDIIIWDRQKEYNNMRPLGYPYKFIINKVHEYLIIFEK